MKKPKQLWGEEKNKKRKPVLEGVMDCVLNCVSSKFMLKL